MVALEGENVIGYNALTRAEIGGQPGVALEPLGVGNEYQNKGVEFLILIYVVWVIMLVNCKIPFPGTGFTIAKV